MGNEKPPNGGNGDRLPNRGGEEEKGKVLDFKKFRQKKEKQALPDADERTVHISESENDEIARENLPSASAEIIPIKTEVGLDRLYAEYDEKLKTASLSAIHGLVLEFIDHAKGIFAKSNHRMLFGNMPEGESETEKAFARISRDTISFLERPVNLVEGLRMEPYYRGIARTAMRRVVTAMKIDLAEAE